MYDVMEEDVETMFADDSKVSVIALKLAVDILLPKLNNVLALFVPLGSIGRTLLSPCFDSSRLIGKVGESTRSE